MQTEQIESLLIENNGKIVTIDSLKYKLQTEEYTATYPYSHRVFRVYAEPINKKSKHYLEVRNILRDDWSLVVYAATNYDFDTLNQVLEQLKSPDLITN